MENIESEILLTPDQISEKTVARHVLHQDISTQVAQLHLHENPS